ncbi:MAG TPA: ADP-forming succinate--CoA ligase subunit beta [Gammaproteobacteria bacterium]|nr:ADP-forming succinate--CoA ligase subunit beta [Gammaproteobacteria bacterium]
MNLHEYQAKQLFADYGIAVPQGSVAATPSAAGEAASLVGGNRWVVKAQVHAGGRGKAGGVKLVDSKTEVEETAKAMLGTHLVTFQTDEKGQPVNSVLIEEVSDIARELYLGAVVDRGAQRVIFMASTEGGMDIEEVAEKTPEKILQAVVNPMVGLQPYQARKLAFGLQLQGDQIKQFTKLISRMAKMFVECDLSLLEVNPLVVTGGGQLVCLDGKVNIDDNALYRQPKLAAMRDASQENEMENQAAEHDLNYVALDGNIGCMVNGAGLAMATMDIIKLHGGDPANFLDVGGGATKERVAEAFKLILSDDNVKAVLVNIFGGIVRCDLIADGVIAAVEEVGVNVPVVVRLAGNNAHIGAEKLDQSGLNIIAAEELTDAAQKVVKSVGAA